MPEESDEKIEEIVDQKVEEKLHEKLSGEDTGDDYISRKIEEKLQELSETEGDDSDGSLDRRSFLKMLGLGAGGLALASPVSSFIPLASSSGGGGTGTLSDVLSNGNDINGHDIVDSGTTVWDTSAGHIPSSVVQTAGLDADTVDGKEASSLERAKVKRDANGQVVFTDVASKVISTGKTYTFTTNLNDVIFDRARFSVNSGTAKGVWYRNGSLVGTSTSNSLISLTAKSIATPNPAETFKIEPGASPTTTTTTMKFTEDFGYVGPSTDGFTGTTTTTRVIKNMSGYIGGNIGITFSGSARGYFYYNGNLVGSGSIAPRGTLGKVTDNNVPSLTSATITWKIHASSSNSVAFDYATAYFNSSVKVIDNNPGGPVSGTIKIGQNRII
ncbi:MAG: twin-arginine translocation signal domain-containing protein [Candidatus Nanohaloarchaea archaeon]